MLSAITGDIIGSSCEFHKLTAKNFQPLFHAQARFTDGTVFTVALANALVHGRDLVVALQ